MAVPKRFSQWEEKAVKDYDPDADAVDSDGSGSDEGADLAGTEHYESVGKSKLRQKESVSLGPKYRGSRVSREALEKSGDDSHAASDDFEDAQEMLSDDDNDDDQGEEEEDAEGSDEEEYDDPKTADLAADQTLFDDDDAEIDSDNALVESDEEELQDFVFRGSSKPRSAVSEEEEKKKKKKKKKKNRPVAADYISSSDEGAGVDSLENFDEEDSDIGGAGLLDMEAEEETEESASGDEDEDEGEDEDIDGLDDLDGFIDDGEGTESSEDEEDDEEGSTAGSRAKGRAADARAEQRRLMNEGQKALVATISAAAQQDAQKGQAVRQQRKAFDGLLNLRIRLQKAMVATNSFSAFDDDEDSSKDSAPYEAAEEAALKLLATLDSVRSSLVPPQATGEKRKRDADITTPSAELWKSLQETDERAAKYRKKVLETWASKTKNATVEVKSRNLVASRQSLIASLEDQLFQSERLIMRTRTPRSCAPVQVAKKMDQDASIYDDADFYQLLLKELVDQRTADEAAGNGVNGSMATVRWAAAAKEAKTRKQVDRRASKGRKMRFNVHEKLQNFMAPEDRRSWEQDAIDRLFGTLFGQKMELAEGGFSDEEMDGVNAEEEGLRLFRS